jgi:hypothetical protein
MTEYIPEELVSHEVTDTAELDAVEGGVWWCGTGLPHSRYGIPLPPPPPPAPFGKGIANV